MTKDEMLAEIGRLRAEVLHGSTPGYLYCVTRLVDANDVFILECDQHTEETWTGWAWDQTMHYGDDARVWRRLADDEPEGWYTTQDPQHRNLFHIGRRLGPHRRVWELIGEGEGDHVSE